MHGAPLETMEKFKLCGADEQMEDIEGLTPVQYAINHNHSHIVSWNIECFGIESVLMGNQRNPEAELNTLASAVKKGSWICVVIFLVHSLSHQSL